MNLLKKYIFFFLVSGFTISCSNSGNDYQESNSNNREESMPPEKNQLRDNVASDNPDYLAGEKYYGQYCLACHQQDGMGVSGLNPPLAQSSRVLGEKKRLVEVVLKGLSGGKEIDGNTYSNTMGSFTMLKDKEIALILSYIRNSFGNNAATVSEKEVADFRKNFK